MPYLAISQSYLPLKNDRHILKLPPFDIRQEKGKKAGLPLYDLIKLTVFHLNHACLGKYQDPLC